MNNNRKNSTDSSLSASNFFQNFQSLYKSSCGRNSSKNSEELYSPESSASGEDVDNFSNIIREPVILNVYDMFWTNSYTSAAGIGIYHSGVEVYGREFAFGGHPFGFSGVFEISPRDESKDLGEHYLFKESHQIGYTSMPQTEVDKIIDQLGREFGGNSYHLINKNCNHFSSHLSQLLSPGNEFPPWINRLAYVSGCLPFMQKLIPKEWLTPPVDMLTQNPATPANQENQFKNLYPKSN